MNHITLSSIKEFLFSKQMAMVAGTALVIFVLQSCIEMPFVVWFPAVMLLSMWVDERVNYFMMICNLITMAVIMAIYCAIVYLQPFFAWCNF